MTISATRGGATAYYVIDSGNTSERSVFQRSYFGNPPAGAGFGRMPVVVDLVPNKSEIHRVNPFARGLGVNVQFEGEYLVSRIATQRKDDGSEEHLEVFLKQKSSGEEKAYNVFDPFLQCILVAGFGVAMPPPLDASIDVTFDNEQIRTVTLGLRDIKSPG